MQLTIGFRVSLFHFPDPREAQELTLFFVFGSTKILHFTLSVSRIVDRLFEECVREGR